jgi:ComF family protein
LRILTAFRDALLPNRCAACGDWIPASDAPLSPSTKCAPDGNGCEKIADPDQNDTAKAIGLYAAGLSSLDAMLCGSCGRQIAAVAPPLCSVCGRMFAAREGDDHRCGDCIRQPRHFARARSALLYTSGFRKVVHQFKYRGRMQLADPLGSMLLATYLRFWHSDDIDLILPVPLHPKRFRQRGFNQAYRLVANWKHLERGLAATPGLLVKTRATAPQTGLKKEQRRRNVRNCFDVPRPEAVRSRRILLVDDVYTTGATADECARVLLRSGAARVEVLTLARVL